MTPANRSARRERPRNQWFRKLLENLRSQLTWTDLVVGTGAVALIALLLVGYRYDPLPDFSPGAIATEDVLASQDVTYIDVHATEESRAAARAGAGAVYTLNTGEIAARTGNLAKAFAAAREVLGRRAAKVAAGAKPRAGPALVEEIGKAAGAVFPPEIVRILSRQGFDAALEDRTLRLLDRTLREGVIRDGAREQFLQHHRAGMIVRDGGTGSLTAGPETIQARDLTAARGVLRQYQLEFASLDAPERAGYVDFLERQLFASLTFDEKETDLRREAAAARVPPVVAQVRKGRSIARKGEEITPAMVVQIGALRGLQQPRSLLGQFLGFFIFAAILVYALWRYFVHYQNRHLKIRNHTLLVLLILILVVVVMRLVSGLASVLTERLSIGAVGSSSLVEYAVPFAFGAILVTLLVDTSLGILAAIILSILSGLLYSDISLATYVFLGSLSGIYSVRQYKDRAAIQKAGLTIGVTNFLCIVGIDLLHQVDFTGAGVSSRAGYAMASGLLTSAIASSLLPPLESLFKITTDIRLLELSNLNAPILRRMSVEAPGTYHHSIMVGTLAEAAAEAIGANPLLARVGAYYHDIGKMVKPEYFVENQAFGSNKHEALSPNMSCLIIASHVREGLELAKEIGLPKKIRDLIPQHHGTRVMSYFFRKAQEAADARNGEIVEENFRYPGPKPQTREAGIMMMADSVEAASRTLSNPSPAQIQGMIGRLVDAMVQDNQFDECDITLRDIARVKESFLKTLTGIHHRRIDYPGYDFGSENRAGNGKGQGPNSGIKQATDS